MEKEKKAWRKWIYWFLFAVAVITVYKTLDNFTDIMNWFSNLFHILMPFIIGLLVAYLLYTPCVKIEKAYKKVKNRWIKKKARGLAILTVYLIAILVLLIIVNCVLPVVSRSVADLVNSLPSYYSEAIKKVDEMPEDSLLHKINVKEMISNLQNIDIKQFFDFETITQYAKGVINMATGLFDFFVSIIVSIYILLERKPIIKFAQTFCCAVFEEGTYQNIKKYFQTTNHVFFKFLSGQLLDSIVVGILTSIVMSILQVKYAMLLGFMIGLFNLIPYFGAIIAIILATLITIFTGGIGQAIIMVITVTILQQLDANIINPKILGNSLSISPLLVIFAVTIGGEYFGVLGMFLAVPVFTVLKIIISDYIEYKNQCKT